MKDKFETVTSTPEERQYLKTLIGASKFDMYLLLGGGIFVVLFLWYFFENKLFAIIPSAFYFAGFIWFYKKSKSTLKKAYNKISAKTNVLIEAKGGHYSKTPGRGYWIQIQGVKFRVNQYEWRTVSEGDKVDIRCVPEAGTILELKKNGKNIIKKTSRIKDNYLQDQNGSLLKKRR
jgi:hypothetical protein